MAAWTPQQEAVFAAVRDGPGHVMTEAVAGSGKTTTMTTAVSHARGRVGFVAFNNHIASELQRRLNGAATACTLHSLGLRACSQAWDCEIEENKAKRLLLAQRPKWFWKGRDDQMRPGDEAKATLSLAQMVKRTLSDSADAVQLDGLVELHGIEFAYGEDTIYEATHQLLTECRQQTETVDFDDMVWLPVIRGLNVGGFDVLFVDEVQDLNFAQQSLALRAAPEGRLVPCGDSFQSIYGFTGADVRGMARLRQALTGQASGCVERPLTVTFRCPIQHVDLARQIVPHIEPAADAVNGVLGSVDPEDVFYHVMAGDMVLARRNAPLVDLAYRLIVRGVPTTMRGRDIGKGLTDLVAKLKPDNPIDLIRKLSGYQAKELCRLRRRDATDMAIQSLEDRVTCLAKLASQCETIDVLRGFLTGIFGDDSSDDAGKVVLSSVHRAKGLEANRVVILEPEHLPLIRSDSLSWELEQEMNLAYVAVTRAKQELLFAGDVPAVFSGHVPAFSHNGGF